MVTSHSHLLGLPTNAPKVYSGYTLETIVIKSVTSLETIDELILAGEYVLCTSWLDHEEQSPLMSMGIIHNIEKVIKNCAKHPERCRHLTTFTDYGRECSDFLRGTYHTRII